MSRVIYAITEGPTVKGGLDVLCPEKIDNYNDKKYSFKI